MQKINLFSNDIWKTKISPDTYDKQKLIENIEYNYHIDPHRNLWDKESDIHHTYGDWLNKKFKILNFDLLLKQYDKAIKTFMDQLYLKPGTKYSYSIDNLTATKTGQHMKAHAHDDAAFSSVHYLSLKKEHSRTRFVNPSIAMVYTKTWSHVVPFFQNRIENSGYYQYYDVEAEEDDLIIFPAYLMHQVEKNLETEHIRITNVVNIVLHN
jgi:uncharacterized protein (TIGR02466 family)